MAPEEPINTHTHRDSLKQPTLLLREENTLRRDSVRPEETNNGDSQWRKTQMPARIVPLLASGAKLSEPEAPTNSGLVCTFLVALVEIV